MSDERKIAKRIKQGDNVAFEELYKQQYYSLKSYARLLLGEKDSEDIIQDAFLNLWIHREQIDEFQSIRGYLFRSIYNASLNFIRKNKRLYSFDSAYRQEIEELGTQFYNPETNETILKIFAKETRQEINHAIESLSPRCREVFSLSYIHNLSGKEISKKLNISISTVENHIHSALKILRKKLINHKNNQYILFAMLLIYTVFSFFFGCFTLIMCIL
ncbi:MAG: RNA polymerase sigma-70 factor [Massilibacteroides sp.]|nr:RNA polymerase sigma-70 factor [Massilibacteroides sp.]MDD4115466.1 RNA polymerase sigma-70 factor [Massilibacteroides sp.]MDD4659578.1 RNA polymerase sigma-70 factor [Massilibacteroides sp.]